MSRAREILDLTEEKDPMFVVKDKVIKEVKKRYPKLPAPVEQTGFNTYFLADTKDESWMVRWNHVKSDDSPSGFEFRSWLESRIGRKFTTYEYKETYKVEDLVKEIGRLPEVVFKYTKHSSVL